MGIKQLDKSRTTRTSSDQAEQKLKFSI